MRGKRLHPQRTPAFVSHIATRLPHNALRLAAFLFLSALPASHAQDVPVFAFPPDKGSINFHVKASVALDGTFDKWNATFTVTSTDAATGVLDLNIQADSVNTGSGMKNGKLKGKDFFDVKNDPWITFHSDKFKQTGPDSYAVHGTFTIRGVSRAETLNLTLFGKGTGLGEIKGTMAFDRKEYGMDSGIPFIRIADRVEVNVDLKVKRISGPPLVFPR